MTPTIDPHSSDVILTGIIEIDKNSGPEKEKYDEFIWRRTENAQKNNFIPAIGSFEDVPQTKKTGLKFIN